jgi:hypothetical protein
VEGKDSRPLPPIPAAAEKLSALTLLIAARPEYKILERSEKVSGINYNSGGNNKGESMNFIVGLFALGVACTANHFWGNTGVLLLLAFWIGIMQGNIVDIKRKGD